MGSIDWLGLGWWLLITASCPDVSPGVILSCFKGMWLCLHGSGAETHAIFCLPEILFLWSTDLSLCSQDCLMQTRTWSSKGLMSERGDVQWVQRWKTKARKEVRHGAVRLDKTHWNQGERKIFIFKEVQFLHGYNIILCTIYKHIYLFR